VLAEIGDDRSRFADARALKAYAGAAPVTRASGKSLTVMHRRVKTNAWSPPSATCSTASSATCTTA
jgi:transposase